MFGRKNSNFGDNISVGVRDLDRASAWYQDKLGLRMTRLQPEDCDALLSLDKDDETGLALIEVCVEP